MVSKFVLNIATSIFLLGMYFSAHASESYPPCAKKFFEISSDTKISSEQDYAYLFSKKTISRECLSITANRLLDEGDYLKKFHGDFLFVFALNTLELTDFRSLGLAGLALNGSPPVGEKVTRFDRIPRSYLAFYWDMINDSNLGLENDLRDSHINSFLALNVKSKLQFFSANEALDTLKKYALDGNIGAALTASITTKAGEDKKKYTLENHLLLIESFKKHLENQSTIPDYIAYGTSNALYKSMRLDAYSSVAAHFLEIGDYSEFKKIAAEVERFNVLAHADETNLSFAIDLLGKMSAFYKGTERYEDAFALYEKYKDQPFLQSNKLYKTAFELDHYSVGLAAKTISVDEYISKVKKILERQPDLLYIAIPALLETVELQAQRPDFLTTILLDAEKFDVGVFKPFNTYLSYLHSKDLLEQTRAVENLENLARNGNKEASFFLAVGRVKTLAVFNKTPPSREDFEALKLWENQGKLKISLGYSALGFCFSDSRCHPEPSVELAEKYLLKAATRGEPDAMLRLAELFRNGSESKKPDLTAAVAWATLAEKYGSVGATRLLDEIHLSRKISTLTNPRKSDFIELASNGGLLSTGLDITYDILAFTVELMLAAALVTVFIGIFILVGSAASQYQGQAAQSYIPPPSFYEAPAYKRNNSSGADINALQSRIGSENRQRVEIRPRYDPDPTRVYKGTIDSSGRFNASNVFAGDAIKGKVDNSGKFKANSIYSGETIKGKVKR